MPKLSMTVTEAANKELEELAEELGVSKVEVLRRSLALFSHITDPEKKRRVVIVDDETGTQRELITRLL